MRGEGCNGKEIARVVVELRATSVSRGLQCQEKGPSRVDERGISQSSLQRPQNLNFGSIHIQKCVQNLRNISGAPSSPYSRHVSDEQFIPPQSGTALNNHEVHHAPNRIWASLKLAAHLICFGSTHSSEPESSNVSFSAESRSQQDSSLTQASRMNLLLEA